MSKFIWMIMSNFPANLNFSNIQPNPQTSFNPRAILPYVPKSSVVHHNATAIGPVVLGENVFVAPSAVIRADEGSPMYVGSNSNIQDGVVIHGSKNKPGEQYSILIGNHVSVAHQSLIHGPVTIGNNVLIGFQSMVYNSIIGSNCVLESGAKVVDCTIPDGRYVPAFQIVDSQDKANALPLITDQYKNLKFQKQVLEVNQELVNGYRNYYMGGYNLPAVNPQVNANSLPSQNYPFRGKKTLNA